MRVTSQVSEQLQTWNLKKLGNIKKIAKHSINIA